MKLNISSDNGEASDVLQEIAQLCFDHGAQWHPDLEAEINGESMRLLAPHGCNHNLITMPTDLLLPVEKVCWKVSNDQIVLVDLQAGLCRMFKNICFTCMWLFTTLREN